MRVPGMWTALGLLAAGALGLAPAPPVSRVSYLIGLGEVEELKRVVGDQVLERRPLGINTLFGVADDRLATLAQRDEGGRGVWRLSVFDLGSGTVVSEHTVAARPLTWMSEPEEVVLLRPREGAAYFVTLEVEGSSVWNELARLELATGKLTRVKIPAEVANPRPFGLADSGAVGVYSWNHGLIALLKDGAFTLLGSQGEQARTVVNPSVVSSCLGLPGLGILRVTHSGKAEFFDPAKPSATPSRVLEFGSAVTQPQVATFEGKPVLVYGEAVPGAMGTTAISALLIYDPVAGKQLWRKALPWLARTFTVSRDAGLFRLMPLADVQLQYYDRKTDSFTKSVSLKPREAERVVIVPSD